MVLASLLLLVPLQSPMAAGPETDGPSCRVDRLAEVRVLVLDLESNGAQSASTKTLGQIVAREAARAPGHKVITHDDLRAVLDQEAEKQLMGCSESTCMSEFADALDADFLVSGRLDASNADAPVLSLTLLNTRALVTVNRVSMTWAGAKDRLPDVARAGAMLLLFEKRDRPPGAIAIDGAPDDARVFVDSEDVTATLAGGTLPGVEIGTHTLRIEADGYEPRETPVLVLSGETARVDGALESRPLYTNMWVWGGVGAAVLTTAAATAAVLVLTRDATVTTTATVTPVGLANVEAAK